MSHLVNKPFVFMRKTINFFIAVLALPIMILTSINWRGIYNNLIFRDKYLSADIKGDVDARLAKLFKRTIAQLNFPPLETAILTAIGWEYYRLQTSPDRERNCLENIRASVHHLYACFLDKRDISFDDILMDIRNRYAEKPINNLSSEQISSSEILALSEPMNYEDRTSQIWTWLKIFQAIASCNQSTTQQLFNVPHTPKDTSTPLPYTDSALISYLDQQFYCRMFFTRALIQLVAHVGLNENDAKFIHLLLSLFTQQSARPGNRRLVRRLVINAVDFERIRQHYLELSLDDKYEKIGYQSKITPEVFHQAKNGHIDAVIRIAGFILLASASSADKIVRAELI